MTAYPTRTISLDPYGVPAEPRNGAARRHPPLAGVYRARCGEEWEAIRVLAADGQRALRQLGQQIGSVVASNYHGSWTFLIESQPVIELPLPGARGSGRDVRWVIPPGGMTHPPLLHQVLARQTTTPQTTSGKSSDSFPSSEDH